MVSENAMLMMHDDAMMLCSITNMWHTQTSHTIALGLKACMRFKGKHPPLKFSWFILSYKSNQVLRDLNIIDPSQGWLFSRQLTCQPKPSKFRISMSVVSSINQLQSSPKPVISLLSKGQDGMTRVLKVS